MYFMRYKKSHTHSRELGKCSLCHLLQIHINVKKRRKGQHVNHRIGERAQNVSNAF